VGKCTCPETGAAAACSLVVPFGSTPALVTFIAPEDISVTCPGDAVASTSSPDITRRHFSGICPGITPNVERTVVVTAQWRGRAAPSPLPGPYLIDDPGRAGTLIVLPA